MKAIFQKMRNISLRNKLTFTYLIAFLTPLILLTSFTIHQMFNITQDKSNIETASHCEQISSNIYYKLQTYFNSLENFSNTQSLREFLYTEFSDVSTYFAAYPSNIFAINSFTYANPMIKKATVYTNNPYIVTNGSNMCKMNESEEKLYDYLELDNVKGAPIDISVKSINGEFIYFLTCQIKNHTSNKYKALFQAKIEESELYSLIYHETNNMDIYLIGSNGTVFTSTDRTAIGTSYQDLPALANVNIGSLKPSAITKQGTRLLYATSLSYTSQREDWHIVFSMPNAHFTKEMEKLLIQVIVIILFILAYGIVLIRIFSYTLTSRLQKLVKNIEAVRKGEFKIQINSDATDEIGVLTSNFAYMISDIDYLISEVHVQELKVSELEMRNEQAKLHALQSQISPHFLFNTMQSISISAYQNHDYETANSINRFCKLMRESLFWETKRISMAQELDIVENYLELQKSRYENWFSYKIDVPKEFEEVLIPKFTLQPLVENAIYHGLESRSDDGFLSICAKSVDECVIITVEDNGIGMSSDLVDQINNSLEKNDEPMTDSNVGIKNANSRLKLYYGEHYGIRLYSTQDIGTRVVVTLPKGEK